MKRMFRMLTKLKNQNSVKREYPTVLKAVLAFFDKNSDYPFQRTSGETASAPAQGIARDEVNWNQLVDDAGFRRRRKHSGGVRLG